MARTTLNGRICSVPAQIVDIHNGIVLKRGCSEVKITGPDARRTVQAVLAATCDGGATLKEIETSLPDFSKPQVKALVTRLLERGFLVRQGETTGSAHSAESHLDIFFWHFDGVSSAIVERFRSTHLLIVGLNHISRQLASSLLASGHQNFELVDDPRQRNLDFFNGVGHLKSQAWGPSSDRIVSLQEEPQTLKGDCLIATSDFGGQEALLRWNRLCLKQSIKFMPITLVNLTGFVGPLVIPGETACYRCFLSRYRSHSEDDQIESLIDASAFEGQRIIGFHPAMASILGDIAAFELTRFFIRPLPHQGHGRLLEVNLLAAGMTARRILKIPRCLDCSPFHQRSSLRVTDPSLGDHVL